MTFAEKVKKLIHQFETHPNRGSLMADLDKNQKFNPFSQKSKEFIRSMGNMEYVEMCEITSKVHCHDCLLYWEVGVVYCTCGTCLRPSLKNRKLKSCQSRIMLLRRDHLMELDAGNEFNSKLTTHSGRQRNMVTKPFWTDS